MPAHLLQDAGGQACGQTRRSAFRKCSIAVPNAAEQRCACCCEGTLQGRRTAYEMSLHHILQFVLHVGCTQQPKCASGANKEQHGSDTQSLGAVTVLSKYIAMGLMW